MGEHRTLRAAGGSRSIKQAGEVVIGPNLGLMLAAQPRGNIGQGAAALLIEGGHGAHAFAIGKLANFRLARWIANDERGARVLNEIFDL